MTILSENRNIVSDRIKQLVHSADQEDDLFSHELLKFEKSVIGTETKSLIGKFNLSTADNEALSKTINDSNNITSKFK